MNHDYSLARERMVRNQLISRGITDQRVLQAMSRIPRHLFIEEALEGEAYNDHPLPIGHKQTISQPYIVAMMTEALELKGGEKTLEIGTGSGYQTAILAELSRTVCTVERIRPLMERARGLLEKQGYNNVLYRTNDGSLGWKDFEPYDAIMVTAGAPKIPEPLIKQLSEGGRMVIPVGNRFGQDLIKVTRVKSVYKQQNLGGCRFVDLVGAHGWDDSNWKMRS
jgi:protein-L-isoaspartate(D-aspartate) O-methyltransferase